MSRQSTIQRVPSLPALRGGLANHDADVKMLHGHLEMMTTLLNQAVQSLENRVNTIQQVGAVQPPPVSGLTVTGKQGLFHLTWNRMKNVDGYVVVQASDSAMQTITGRYHVDDSNQPIQQIPVGNVAITAYFQVYAYQGQKYADPSPIVSATTLTYGASEAAPSSPPIAPLPPKISPVRSGPNL